MAEESAKLRIPYIAASQAQKHVTHNEAMTLLDTLVQLSVLDKDLWSPPAEPDEGDCYIVAGSIGGGTATGAWAGWETSIARYLDGEWRSYLPGQGGGAGWLAWVLDEDAMYRFDGAAWTLAGIEGPEGPQGPAGADGQSFQPDAVAALIGGRNAYDDEAAAFSVLVVADATNGDQPTLYFKLSAASADWSDPITWLPASSGGGGLVAPQGRLTLVSSAPVMTASQIAKTAIYWTPIDGGFVPFWDGAAWSVEQLSELSLALTANAGYTGYHQSGKNFDLFIDENGGSPRLVSGPAWSSDTARGYSLSRVNGVLLNAAAMTVRFGTGVSDTASIPAERLIYVGTFRASAGGQTQFKLGSAVSGGGEAWVGIWNAYHRVPVSLVVQDSDVNWTYATTAFRSFNNSAGNRASFVRGLDEDGIEATFSCIATAGAAGTALNGIALDATNTNHGSTGYHVSGNGVTSQAPVFWAGMPGVGFHYLQATEYAENSATVTFYGSASSALYRSGLYVLATY